VAAYLAISVLLLDGSWLEPQWRLTNFLVEQKARCEVNVNGTTVQQEEVYLPFEVVPDQPLSQQSLQDYHLLLLLNSIRCATLFVLGLGLIQLSLGRPMAELGFRAGNDEDDILVNRKTANRLLHKVIEESGLKYGDVVRRCLDCPYDSSDPSFDDTQFQGFVYEKIVSPLLADCQAFEQA
jgi:hypothetical protein